MASSITDGDVALEASALTGRCLLLNRHDLHHLVLEGGADEVVNNLILFDGKGEKEDLLDRLDLALLHETAELGDRDPLVFVVFLTTSAASTSSSTVTPSTFTA